MVALSLKIRKYFILTQKKSNKQSYQILYDIFIYMLYYGFNHKLNCILTALALKCANCAAGLFPHLLLMLMLSSPVIIAVFLQACSLRLTCECVYLSCVPLLRQKWRTRSLITKTWQRCLRLKPFMKCRGQTSGPMSPVTDTAPMTG